MIRISGRVFLLSALSWLLALPATAQLRGNSPKPNHIGSAGNVEDPQAVLMQESNWTQKMDSLVPLDAKFQDESGRTVRLGDYFGKKPVALVLSYYNCAMVCPEIISGTVRSYRDIDFGVGQDFEAVYVSIDPRETPKLSLNEKGERVAQYGRKGAGDGFHFLTGDETSIKALTQSVGFGYAYDAKTNQYAHPGGIVLLTPQGHVARYLPGLMYEPRDLRFALIEASQNKIGSVVDQVILTCFHYNPKTGIYSLALTRIIQIAGLLTVASIMLGVGIALSREKKAQRKMAGVPQEATLGSSS